MLPLPKMLRSKLLKSGIKTGSRRMLMQLTLLAREQ